MSLMLASDEKIIREYEYASVGTVGVGHSSETYKKLIITNKRIVHQEHATGVGMERYCSSEMPIEKATYVDTYYGMKSYTALLVLGILFAIAALVVLIAGLHIAIVVAALVVAVAFILIYIFKRDYMVTFSIKTDGFVNPALFASSLSGSSLTRNIRRNLRAAEAMTTINIKIRVHKEEAKLLAQELGTAILEASRSNSEETTPDLAPDFAPAFEVNTAAESGPAGAEEATE